jgi:hypothetical protein
MNPYEPHARVQIYEEQTSEGKRSEQNTHYLDSWEQGGLFSAVKVELTTGKASQFELTVVDKDFRFINQYSRAAGIPLLCARLWLCFGEKFGTPVFHGMLASVEHSGMDSTLRFYDFGMRMRLVQKTELHKGLDIDVMRKLVERNGLKFVGPGDAFHGIAVTSAKHTAFKGVPLKSAKQEAQTDWDYVARIAADAGLVIYVRNETFFASLPARTGDPVLSFKPRDVRLVDESSLRYRTPENQLSRPRSVEQRGRKRGGGRLSGIASEDKRGREVIVTRAGLSVASQSELKRRAQARKELETEPTFTGSIVSMLQTNVRADVRDTVELQDWGRLFSGKYLCDSVDYDFSPGVLDVTYDLYRGLVGI